MLYYISVFMYACACIRFEMDGKKLPHLLPQVDDIQGSINEHTHIKIIE